MFSFINILLAGFFLFIIPLCLGYLWCDSTGVRINFASLYVFGTFLVWAYSQVILVPLILQDVSFTVATIVLLIITCVFVMLSFLRFHRNDPLKRNHHFKKLKIKDIALSDRICFVLLAAVVVFIIIHSMVLQHIDDDDSRYVVLALDTIKSDRMLRINPATGSYLTEYIGEMKKDFASPWMVYMAYISNICGMKATVMIHSVFPVFLYLLVTCGFWLFSDIFFSGTFYMRCLFVALVWYIIIFSNYSDLNSETFIMLRIWQGKAVVAGLTIPVLLYGLVMALRESTWQNWLNIWLVNLGSCLLSGNAIVIGVLMICSYSLVYVLVLKKYRFLLYSIMICGTNFIFYLVNQNANLFL